MKSRTPKTGKRKPRNADQRRPVSVDELRRSIGLAVRRARHAMGWTQEDVSDRIEVSKKFYARVERGNMLPSIGTLAKLILMLGIDGDAALGFKPLGELDVTLDQKGRRFRKLTRRLRKISPQHVRMIHRILDELDRRAA